MKPGAYQRIFKRPADVVIAAVLLVVLAPLMGLIALAVRADSSGPALFSQPRMGRGLRLFWILKFRTMVQSPRAGGPALTVAGDPRVTRIGRILRRSKLDELPQLWNVLRGDMSLVGPRPEMAVYVGCVYSQSDLQLVFSLRPGLTDPATVTLLGEEQLLSEQRDAEAYYLQELLPTKIRVYREYASQVTLRGDLRVIVATLRGMARLLLRRGPPGRRNPPTSKPPARHGGPAGIRESAP